MKKVYEGYVRIDTKIEEYFPPIIDEKEYTRMLNQSLWDKVKITVEVNEYKQVIQT